MDNHVKDFLSSVEQSNLGEVEFLQAVEEVAEAVIPVLKKYSRFDGKKILERMVEPERVISFRVSWIDENVLSNNILNFGIF